MASAKRIIDEIRQLPPRERRIVLKHLEQLRSKPGIRMPRRSGRRKDTKARSYTALIELTGMAHGDYGDVSTD